MIKFKSTPTNVDFEGPKDYLDLLSRNKIRLSNPVLMVSFSVDDKLVEI